MLEAMISALSRFFFPKDSPHLDVHGFTRPPFETQVHRSSFSGGDIEAGDFEDYDFGNRVVKRCFGMTLHSLRRMEDAGSEAGSEWAPGRDIYLGVSFGGGSEMRCYPGQTIRWPRGADYLFLRCPKIADAVITWHLDREASLAMDPPRTAATAVTTETDGLNQDGDDYIVTRPLNAAGPLGFYATDGVVTGPVLEQQLAEIANLAGLTIDGRLGEGWEFLVTVGSSETSWIDFRISVDGVDVLTLPIRTGAGASSAQIRVPHVSVEGIQGDVVRAYCVKSIIAAGAGTSYMAAIHARRVSF